jgi:hypothetical protein
MSWSASTAKKRLSMSAVLGRGDVGKYLRMVMEIVSTASAHPHLARSQVPLAGWPLPMLWYLAR